MNKKALKIAHWLTDLFIVLLIICAAALPWMVTWYVETMGRSPKLPTVIMITCYPCVPFAGMILYYLRRLLKNIYSNKLFCEESVKCFTRISLFCLIIAIITVCAGRFYLPFFIVGVAFAFFSLLIYVFKTIFAEIYNKLSNKE